MIDWLARETRFRAGFRDLVELVETQGWRLVVVSSGVRELIEPLLARQGLSRLEVVANELERDSWTVRFREAVTCAVCGERCKRPVVAGLASVGQVVYAGDGYSDACAAEAADVVFARARLAGHLEERCIPFQPFEDFFDVLHALLER